MSHLSEAQVSLHAVYYWADAAKDQQAVLLFIQESNKFPAACRMGTLAQRLEQLDKEISDVSAKLEKAKDEWKINRDPQQEAKLKNIYEDLNEEKKELLEERRALTAKLPSSGEHGLLKHVVSCIRQSWMCRLVSSRSSASYVYAAGRL